MASTTPKAAATMETHAVDASGSRKLAASTSAAAALSRPNIKVVVVGFCYFIIWGICCLLNLYFLVDQLGW